MTMTYRTMGRAGSSRIVIIALAVAVLASLAAFPARADQGADSVRGERDIPATIVHDAGTALNLAVRAYTAPFRWDGSDWLTAGGCVALSGVSALGDEDVRSVMARNHSSTADRAFDAAVAYGDGLNVTIAIGGLYGVGLFIRDPWLRETMMLAGTATLVSASISTVTKLAVGRARPYNELGNHFFKPFSFNEDFVSFPSGHTVVAFSVSSVLAERIGNPVASVVLYALATATAAGRIYQDQHWFSDVVPAALYASIVGRSIVRWYEGDTADPALGIYPGPRSLTVVWRFNSSSPD